MKLNKKEKVFEFIMNYSADFRHEEYPKFTTNFLSEKLDMQRTNLSSILNQLVKEGKLIKHNGRPVLYQFADHIGDGEKIFCQLIGYDGSLKEAVSVAKAAILYPEGKPNILITGQRGCGVTYFAETVFRFAVASGVAKANGSLLTFDCRAYKENEEYRKYVLYGTKEGPDKREGLLQKSRNGMLLIKNVDLLPEYERRQILSEKERGILIFSVSSDIKEEMLLGLKEKADFVIPLPDLKGRALKERFSLIQKFFMEEAGNLKRNLEVDTTVLYGLLLYDTVENITGLKNDIHKGCANCYARAHQSKKRFIEVLISDFSNEIRKGVIYYKVHMDEIDSFLSGDYKYAFTDSNMLRKQKTDKDETAMTIYQSLDARKKQLREQQATEEEIDNLISAKLQSDFQTYFHGLCEKVHGRLELTNYVSGKLIRLVEDFLFHAQSALSETYDEQMIGAICLHINACLIRVNTKQRISNEEIQQMILTYPEEYNLAKDFVRKIEQEFRASMNIDEIIYIILFLIQNKKIKEQRVVTLIAMHGKNGASSIADVVNLMAKESTAFAFNLALDQNMRDAYDELKQTMTGIHQGKGILLIYDMGSIRTMAESIAAETGIEVKYMEVPIALLGIAACNRASENEDLENIFQYLQTNFKNIEYVREQRKSPMSLTELLGEEPAEEVDETGMMEAFDYLRDQFKEIDMDKMEQLLRSFIQQMEYLLDTTLDEDKRIGLVIHLVCLIDRIKHHYTPSINFIASDIIKEHKELVLEVKKILEPLEKEFHVYINDGEIATIISIIRN